MQAQRTHTRALTQATLYGTVLQVAMVVAGHFISAVAMIFGPLGMAISLVAGWLYAYQGKPATKASAAGKGAVAGGVCALIGILISFLLGDVTAVILVFGTLSSAITGALGGLIGQLLGKRSAVRA